MIKKWRLGTTQKTGRNRKAKRVGKNNKMKKIILTLGIFILTILSSHAQEFIPGYYIINSTAQYAVAIPSGADYTAGENGCYSQDENLYMKAGEIVIAFELSKGKFYCFDPNGRMVVFQGPNCLTKAPMVEGAGVGRMDETIHLIDGSSIQEGAYYWIIGQNIANSTLKIQVGDGKTYDIPQGKITLYGVALKTLSNMLPYENVME